jgi:hypothetical protein
VITASENIKQIQISLRLRVESSKRLLFPETCCGELRLVRCFTTVIARSFFYAVNPFNLVSAWFAVLKFAIVAGYWISQRFSLFAI